MQRSSLLLCFALTACTSHSLSQTSPFFLEHQSPAQMVAPVSPPAAVVDDAPRDFEDWKNQFRNKALQQGFAPELVEQLLASVSYQERAVKSDRGQPERTQLIAQYLDKSLSDKRIAEGRQKLIENAQFLRQLEKQHGVPAEIVVAIWGLESSYGSFTGKESLSASLATLAYDGRRREFAENQLLAILRMMQHGDFNPNTAQGSWAGGMGHTQFIPTTWLEQAQDGDGDGHRDPWNRLDALASTASYLRASGWQRGQTFGEVVQLSPEFRDTQLDKTLPRAQLQSALHTPLKADKARIWLPSGQAGSALALYPNFSVIKKYNNSDHYALAVSLLAEQIAGRDISHFHFARDQQGLSFEERKALQSRLQSLGYAVGAIDGVLGKQTRDAFRAWQQSQGYFADGFISVQSASPLLR